MSFWNHDALAASLRRALEPPSGDTAADRQLEATRSVTWIALSIRQLADAGRLSPQMQRSVWPVDLHWPLNGLRPSPPSANDFERIYEMSGSRPAVLTTMRLCGMLIHSLVLAPTIADDGTPQGVWFNTMLTRDQGVFHLDWEQLRLLVDVICEELAGSGVIHGV